MTHTLTARRLITSTETIDYPVISVTPDGTIASITSDPHNTTDETTLTAAFLDIHTHGAMGHDVMTATPSALSELQLFLAKKGVAHYLPTTVTDSIDNTLCALEALATLVESSTPTNEAKPVGIHLEGPFLSHAKRGVHPIADLQPPSIDLFDRFHAAARGHIKLLTIAPELPGAIELITHATALGIRISLGHSNALASETLPAIAAGATSATHTFNAMRALDHREPGILGTVLTTDALYAELICDGIHVAPALVQLWLRAKGGHHAILVTDSMSATGMPDGQYTLANQPVTVANGRASMTQSPTTLAGSILTLDAAVANLQHFTDTTLSTASRAASHNPATMLGLPSLTALTPGSAANLNRFHPNGHLLATYLHGQKI